MPSRITAMDVENQQFRRKLRGFEPAEVQMYLHSVAEEIERLNLENGELREGAGKLKTELEELKTRERALQETLVAAQKMAEEMKSRARSESELLVRDARVQAERITREAQDALGRLESDIGRSSIEREAVERRLRGVLEQHLALLDLRKEARGDMDNLRVMPPRVGTEVG